MVVNGKTSSKTEISKTEISKTEISKTEISKTEISKTEISKTEIFKRPMNFGGAVEIRTQVARPPVLQDGPSYPTAPRSRLCFSMAILFLCLPSSTIVIKYLV